MSDQKKYPRPRAMNVALELQAMLSPACERIAIVGSLRREKPMVGDIELLYKPRYSERPDGLFDNKIVNVAHEVVEKLVKDKVLALRPNVNGSFTFGEYNKLCIHCASGIPVDLFSIGQNPEKWWVSLVIRTGSKETNLRLTTGANNQNARLLAYGSGVSFSDGSITSALSERHVFELCKVPYLEPENR